MLIDMFAHFVPDQALDNLVKLNSRCSELQDGVLMADSLHDVDARFRQMDEIGGFPHVIMSSNPPLEEMDSPEQGAEAARIVNDALAETQHAHPDRFPAFAGSLALHNVEASVDEVHRLMRDLGAKGVQLNTNATGLALDDPRFAPVFDALHEEDATIWMHPQRTHLTKDYEGEEFARYATWASMGWPCATTVAMIRMAATGMFDRYPGMRVITHHLGGMIPFFAERAAIGFTHAYKGTPDENHMEERKKLKGPSAIICTCFTAIRPSAGCNRRCAAASNFSAPRMWSSPRIHPSANPWNAPRCWTGWNWTPTLANIGYRNAEKILKMKFA